MSGILDPAVSPDDTTPTRAPSGGAERRRGGTLGTAGWVATAVVLLAVVAAVAPGVLGGAHPLAVHPDEALLPPSGAHPFGTDESGRDVLARVVAGTRASLVVGVAATLVGAVTGVLLGLVAGSAAGCSTPSWAV